MDMGPRLLGIHLCNVLPLHHTDTALILPQGNLQHLEWSLLVRRKRAPLRPRKAQRYCVIIFPVFSDCVFADISRARPSAIGRRSQPLKEKSTISITKHRYALHRAGVITDLTCGQETTWTCPPEFTSSGVTTEPKDEWQTFYTNEGKPYYYNARTNVTSWTKPESASAADSETAAESADQDHTAELSGEPSPIPTETRDGEQAHPELPSRPKPEEPVEVIQDPVVAVPYKAAYASQYANREEAEAAFREMLTSSGVPSTATWEQALPKIVNDKRYTALPKLADRKEVFKSWCVEHAEREKENALRAEQQKRDDFLALLAEHSNIIRSRMRFVELEPKIRLDPR